MQRVRTHSCPHGAPADLAKQNATAAWRDRLAGRSTAPDFLVRGRQAWNETQHRDLAAAKRLEASSDPADRQLADQERQFVGAGRTPTIHERSVAAMERKRQSERSRNSER